MENMVQEDFVVHPTVWRTDGWSEQYSTKSSLPLTEKYDKEIQKELCMLSDVFYTQTMLMEFQHKCKVVHQKNIKGNLNVSFAFLDPRLPESVVIMRSKGHNHVIGEPVSSYIYIYIVTCGIYIFTDN